MKGSKRKSFEQHSERWQREAKREGIDPRKWNMWNKLSAASRRIADPRKYGAGHSVAEQRLDAKRSSAVARLVGIFSKNARPATIRRGVKDMTNAQLNRIVKSATDADVKNYVQRQARKPVAPGAYNPFWYR